MNPPVKRIVTAFPRVSFYPAIVLWLFLIVDVQALDPNTTGTRYGVKKWGAREGLPQLTVQKVLQTRDGYLWLGTQSALVRFDGLGFDTFKGDRVPALGNAYIEALFEDSRGKLWIGTWKNGLLCYQNGEFKVYSRAQGLRSDDILSVEEGKGGGLWVGTRDGLHLKSGEIFHAFTREDGLKGKEVHALLRDKQGRLWIGTEGGLNRLTEGTISGFHDQELLNGNEILALYEDPAGGIWISVARYGLVLFKNDSFQYFPSPKGTIHIYSICRGRAGELWLGSEERGLLFLANGQYHSINAEERLEQNPIFTLFEDREKNLWVGTRLGLYRYRGESVYRYGTEEGLSAASALSVYEDDLGVVWIGTQGGGLNRLEAGRIQVYGEEHGLPGPSVKALYGDGSGGLWVGTRDGLAFFRNGRFKTYTTANGLAGNYIRALMVDREGRVWVGTKHGISVGKNGIFTNYTTGEGLSHNVVRGFFQDHDGDVWIGTDEGLTRFQDGKLEVYDRTYTFSREVVVDIYQDAEGDMWIATLGGGLHRLRNGSLFSFSTKEGLYDNSIMRLLEDDSGFFWMTTMDAVFRVRKQDLNDIAGGRIHRLKYDLYGTRADSFPVEYNGGVYPAGWQTEGGQMLLPTSGGLIVVDPNKIQINPIAPQVHIQKFLADGIPRGAMSLPRIPPRTHRIEFEYTGLSFTRPEKVSFEVKLEGYDKGWVALGKKRSVAYSRLPHGTYTFRVRATNEDGIRDEAGAHLSFYWEPYFFETLLFYSLGFLGLVGISLVGVRWRIRKFQKRGDRLEALVRSRTRDLELANTEIRLTQERLVTAAHLEGMAEIAVNVLHNVGNSLNSVNVSANLIENRAEKLMAEPLKRVVHLLTNYSGNLDTFLRQDERGAKVFPALQNLTTSLLRSREEIIRETRALNDKVRDVTRIIFAQEEYVGGFYRDLDLGEVIREATDVQRPAMKKRDIRCLVEIQDSAIIRAEKNKFIQLITNLIKNAWESVAQMKDSQEKVVTIKTKRTGTQWIRVDIADNGVGIANEEITRIFQQGYSHKVGGNGFGLHFCGNVIAEMNGHISVHSRGVGLGAVFTIELPVTSD